MPRKQTTKKPSSKKKPTARRRMKAFEPEARRTRAGDDAFNLETSEGRDALAEEMGEEYLENVTGANDSASEHREKESLEEQGSFVMTSAETEFAYDEDASDPPDAEPAPLPTS